MVLKSNFRAIYYTKARGQSFI